LREETAVEGVIIQTVTPLLVVEGGGEMPLAGDIIVSANDVVIGNNPDENGIMDEIRRCMEVGNNIKLRLFRCDDPRFFDPLPTQDPSPTPSKKMKRVDKTRRKGEQDAGISEGDDDCLVDTPEVNAIKRSKRRVFDDDSDVEYVVPPPDNRKKSRIKKSRKGHNNDLNREDDDVLKVWETMIREMNGAETEYATLIRALDKFRNHGLSSTRRGEYLLYCKNNSKLFKEDVEAMRTNQIDRYLEKPWERKESNKGIPCSRMKMSRYDARRRMHKLWRDCLDERGRDVEETVKCSEHTRGVIPIGVRVFELPLYPLGCCFRVHKKLQPQGSVFRIVLSCTQT